MLSADPPGVGGPGDRFHDAETVRDKSRGDPHGRSVSPHARDHEKGGLLDLLGPCRPQSPPVPVAAGHEPGRFLITPGSR